jgi:hypothetical protein
MTIAVARIAMLSKGPRLGMSVDQFLADETAPQASWKASRLAMASEDRLRVALQTPMYRGFFRKLTYPFLFDAPVNLRNRSEEVSVWFAERGARTYGDVPFARRNFGPKYHQVLVTDVIDFPEPDMAFEFKMVWL